MKKPSEVKFLQLQCLFGNCETETAANVYIQACVKADDNWIRIPENAIMTTAQETNNTSRVQTGLQKLLDQDFLRYTLYFREFKITSKFLDALN